MQWNKQFAYEVALKFVDGVAQSYVERICIRMETDGGRAYEKVTKQRAWRGGAAAPQNHGAGSSRHFSSAVWHCAGGPGRICGADRRGAALSPGARAGLQSQPNQLHCSGTLRQAVDVCCSCDSTLISAVAPGHRVPQGAGQHSHFQAVRLWRLGVPSNGRPFWPGSFSLGFHLLDPFQKTVVCGAACGGKERGLFRRIAAGRA